MALAVTEPVLLLNVVVTAATPDNMQGLFEFTITHDASSSAPAVLTLLRLTNIGENNVLCWSWKILEFTLTLTSQETQIIRQSTRPCQSTEAL